MKRPVAGIALAAIAVSFSLLAALTVLPSQGLAAISATKHNLSVTGPSTIKAASEVEICVFCHAPHNTLPAQQLWNRRVGASYTPYTSSTRKSAAGQPNGASLLCLSCHDGTIALGELRNRPAGVGMAGGVTTLPVGNTRLGTDLSDDHPVSLLYDAALRTARGELADPATLVMPNKVRLDGSSRLQCTSCHEPHDNTYGKFLVVDNTASALCNTCHFKDYWTGSDHRNSTKTWNMIGTNPWPHTSGTTVAANACENCHRPHTAGTPQRILNFAPEEANCLSCHSGNVATKNIQSELAKASHHGVASYTNVHDAAETDPVGTPHVECVDCHNPHAANATAGSAPGATPITLPGSLAGTRGISSAGAAVKPVTAEYQICYRCHADTVNRIPAPRTSRVIAQGNKRLQFTAGNPSSHPIAGVGASTNVPSLILPWKTTSVMNCTDCHNNNAGPNAAGTGPNGPHGSTYPLLLERQYVTTDNTTESAANYALCYKCHNRTSILGNVGFKEHNLHIVGQRTPCNVCHDPHGISSTQGTVANNSRLINFDSKVVTAYNGLRRWTRVGAGGRCDLVCHGQTHNNYTY